jgi:hypothetical protein
LIAAAAGIDWAAGLFGLKAALAKPQKKYLHRRGAELRRGSRRFAEVRGGRRGKKKAKKAKKASSSAKLCVLCASAVND